MKELIHRTITSKKFLLGVITSLLIVVCILSGLVFRNKSKFRKHKIIHDTGVFKLTSPILDCEPDGQGEESVVPFNKVNDFVDKLKSKYNITNISVYFRDLNDGPWVGINEKDYFSPASLLKLPVLISYLKYTEDNPKIADSKVLITPADTRNLPMPNIKSTYSLQVGSEYTLDEVASFMIKYSDNIGAKILLNTIPKKYLEDLFNSLGITYLENTKDSNIQVTDYAGFFRILYNASYLNRKNSEKALSILTNVEYKNALVAGVPDGVPVAHKFGERSLGNVTISGDVLTGETQLHDCGIIYFPGRPYLLCVMSRGENFSDQENAIRDVSKFFYEEIKALHS